MPRIPPEKIERLKREIPIQRLAEDQGIKLKPHGKNLIGLCKFHIDHSPSLVIDTEKNIWNCLGACGKGGSVIDWVMEAEKVDFLRAVEVLQKLPGSGSPVPGNTGRKVFPAPVDFNAEEKELLKQVIEYYHQTLKKSPEALSYLEKRGLNNSEMIDRFKIGYVNRTFGNQLPEKNRKDGAAIRERLTKTGILRESGHELFNGAVVFPIFDECGQVTEIYGRKILDNLREGTAYHLYLPGPHKGNWNLEGIQGNKEIIIHLENLRWRFRGLSKNTNHDQLKVNIRISNEENYFLDTLDLCSARARAQFQKQASEELKVKEEVIKSDLGKVLPKLEELRDQRKKDSPEPKEKEFSLSPDDRKEALALLQTPNLLERILSDFEKCGIVGEEIDKLVGYLAAVSRKMENPLAIIIQSYINFKDH